MRKQVNLTGATSITNHVLEITETPANAQQIKTMEIQAQSLVSDNFDPMSVDTPADTVTVIKHKIHNPIFIPGNQGVVFFAQAEMGFNAIMRASD